MSLLTIVNSIKLAVRPVPVCGHQRRHYVYHKIYKGPFEYKRRHTKAYQYPFGVNRTTLEDEFNEIDQIRQLDIKEVSPFHLVWRYKSMFGIPWHERFTLAHLGLHHEKNNVRTVVPNTPHFNQLLYRVKHLIKLMPVSFPDGIPAEKDIGAVKLEPHTGLMRVNESFKIPKEKLDLAKMDDIFYGKYLREYLKWCSGLFKSLPHSPDLLEVESANIEQHRRKVRNANKHQHLFYRSRRAHYWQ